MAQKDLSQFNILLVDDAPIILELMKNMFIDFGYLGVVTATNGVEALQKIQEQTFDHEFRSLIASLPHEIFNFLPNCYLHHLPFLLI